MYRHQKKHRIISIFLVLTLLILTNFLVFSSPVLAEDETWSCPDIPIILSSPGLEYHYPVVPPMPKVNKLILDIPDPGIVCIFSVALWSEPSVQDVITFQYLVGSWSVSHPFQVYDSKIEVSFDPPLTNIDKVVLTYDVQIPLNSIFIEQLQLVWSPPNQAPVAEADGPYNGFVGDPVALDGSGSSDPDNDIILYEWDFDGDGTYDYSSLTNPNTTHAYPSASVYDATLRVTDDDGLTDTDTATVTISEQLPPNQAPVAEADAYATDEDTALDIDVTVNDTDVDGIIDKTTVTITESSSNGALSVNATTGVVTYTPDPNFYGADSFKYTVNDDDGATSNEATVDVTVTDVNEPPVAEITEIDDDDTIVLPVTIKVTPQTLNLERSGKWAKVHVCDDSSNTPQRMAVTLDGSASYDPDGDPLSYDWTLTGPDGDIPVMDDVISQVVILPDGDYTVTLVVNDDTVDSAMDSETFTLANMAIDDLTSVDPGEFTLNGVPASEVKGGGRCLVISFDDNAVGATVEVGLDVEMRLEGPVSGVDYIDVIQDKAGGNGKGKSNLKNEDSAPGQNKEPGDNANGNSNGNGKDSAPGQNKEPGDNANGKTN